MKSVISCTRLGVVIALLSAIGFPANLHAALVSDDFYPETTAQSFWTFVDPVGDCSLTMSGTHAEINVNGGTSHDPFEGGNFAPRLLQSAPNEDFAVEAKFDSAPSSQYQMQGIMVLQANNVFFRFEIYSGPSIICYCAFLNDGHKDYYYSVGLATVPSYLRVARTNDNWTYSYSYDRTTWTVAKTFTQAITVNYVGIYGANHTPNPAFTARAEYFMNLADPFNFIPTSFSAEPAIQQTEIDLDWEKNSYGDNCMIVQSLDNAFGTPVNGTSYSKGGTIPGGDLVIYKGSEEMYTDTGLTPNTPYYYKIWSYRGGDIYSLGLTDSATTAPEPAMLVFLPAAVMLIFRGKR